jgi:putative flippase GtrA
MNESSDSAGFLARLVAAVRRRVLMLKAISFASIGVVNTLVDLGIFLLALQYLTNSLVAANVLAWTIAVSGSYVMNSFVTFAAESGRKLTARAYLTFVASQIVGLIANTAALVIAAMFLPVVVAKLIAIGVGFLVNFSMSHFVVFRPRGRQVRPRAPE